MMKLEDEKNKYRDEAWEYFKKREKLPTNLSRYEFETRKKKNSLDERWGAFRHTYTSAAFTKIEMLFWQNY